MDLEACHPYKSKTLQPSCSSYCLLFFVPSTSELPGIRDMRQALFKDSGISFDSAADCEKYELQVETGASAEGCVFLLVFSMSEFGFK